MSKFRGPLQYSVSDADQFRTVLNEVNYNKSGIADLLTGAAVGNVNLSESLCVSKDDSPLQTLLRLFLLHKNIELGLFQQAVSPMDLSQWIRMGLVRVEQGCVRPLVSIVPCADLLLVCDHHAQDCDPGGCDQSCPEGQCEPGDFVMGLSQSSFRLANATIRREVKSALDLGAGCGIQSLLAAGHSGSVTGIDCNPRAISMARLNSHLNQIDGLDFQQGDMLQPLATQQFDLIVSHPPFVIQPEFDSLYRDSGCRGDDFCRTLVQNAPLLLNEHGTFQMVFDWAHVKGQGWQDRLAQWCEGSGCDAWVMRWDTKDVSDYIRCWNKERSKQPAFANVFDTWMNWYGELGIEAVSSGLLTMRRDTSGSNWFRADDAPADFTSSIGDDVLHLFESSDWLQASDQELLDTCFKLHPAVCLDQQLRQSGGNWTIESASLRRKSGIPYQGEVDALTASLLPQCDGSHRFADLLGSLASRNQRSLAEVTPVYLDVLRRLLRRGFLMAEMPEISTRLNAEDSPLVSSVVETSFTDEPEVCC